MNPNRFKALTTTLVLLYLVNLSRFFYWQIIKSSQFKQQQISQNYKITQTEANPGEIFSADAFPLAINQSKYQVSLYKPEIKAPFTQIINAINLVKPELSASHSAQILKFSQNQSQKWLTLLGIFDKTELTSLNLPGLSFQKTNRRFYPEAPLLTSIINGVETYYSQQINGKTGFSWTPKDAVGNDILSSKTWQIDPVDGRNIHLSLNRYIQRIAEDKIRQGVLQYLAESGSVVILDSQTGHVLAMASSQASPSSSPTKLDPINYLFEPGSIFKPLVIAMALESKQINPNYVCRQCHQPRHIDDHTINNWDLQVHPNSTLQDIITNSDNIGMSYIIDQLGLENFLKYHHLLQLDQKTNIDLPGEAKPNPKKYWSQLDLATASFGQGFATSQIAIVSAFNTLANQGQYLFPKVVDHLSFEDKIINIRQHSPKSIFSINTTNTVTSILQYSVDHSPLVNIKPSGLDICGKSGTAQVAIGGSYENSSANASYIGFFPCHQAKITMIVTLFNPKLSTWGSATAAPIWFEIADDINRLI